MEFDLHPAKYSLPEEASTYPILVVDLDGTLIKTDLLLESFLALLKQKPLDIFAVPLWLLKGKAYLKQQIARRVVLDVRVLPYREELLHYLRKERIQGRRIVLATASDARLANQVGDHLELFDMILASDGSTNLSGRHKRDRLVAEFGEKGFDYAGNDRRDLVVWSSARKAIVVNPETQLRAKAAGVAELEKVCEVRKPHASAYLHALRPQHWLKNALIFVPMLAAHRVFEMAIFAKAVLAFLAFGLCASSGYVLNDLLDLSADRRHPRKRQRPFAAGEVSLVYGLALIPSLFVAGCILGTILSPVFLTILVTYYALSVSYSLYLKRIVLLDVILLAGLYTIRIMAGSTAVDIWPSHWLLALSTFIFMSLALVKRYAELVTMRNVEGEGARARDYQVSDGELLAAMGTACGYVAVLVLALYISSDTAQVLYGRLHLIWLLCPLLFYWISHVWLVAHRGAMHDDPVVFAIKDRISRILIFLMAIVALLAV